MKLIANMKIEAFSIPLIGIFILLAAPLLLHSRSNIQDADLSYKLPEVIGSEHIKDDGLRKLLSKNGFAVEQAYFKQVFEIYLESGFPMYITTDSVFKAYHTIFENMLFSQEYFNLTLINDFSKLCLSSSLQVLTRAKKEEVKEAALMLAAFFGTAAKLSHEWFELHSKIKGIVEEELKNISSREWRISSIFQRKFDYSIFNARGIYSKSPALENYFRTMTFYGHFGFRAKSPKETLAAILLLRMISDNPELKKTELKINKFYSYLIGQADDLTIEEYESVYKRLYGDNPDENVLLEKLPIFQEKIMGLRDPSINDQLLPPEEWIRFKEETKGLRIFGAKYIPDSELFRDLVDADNSLPSGLYIASALGSTRARDIVKEEKSTEFMEKFDEACLKFGKNLSQSNYAKTLRCLQKLLTNPPDSTPQFMRNKAWKDRELFDVLACWASIRHTLVLYAKEEAYWAGGVIGPSNGYVEPRPDFYVALRDLAIETLDKFTEIRGLKFFSNWKLPDDKWMYEGRHSPSEFYRLQVLINFLDFLSGLAEKQLKAIAFSKEENNFLGNYGEFLAWLSFYDGNSWLEPKDDMPIIADVYCNHLIKTVLEVGTGKAMPLYVIVEDNGKKYLCKGAIIGYYEFPYPEKNRLDDVQWRENISKKLVNLPRWTSSFISGINK